MNWSAFITLSVLSATIHWIVARSKIMMWFWAARTMPPNVRDLLECPACSGFWIGICLWCIGVRPITDHSWWLSMLLTGALAVFGTPIAEGVFLWGLERSRISR